MSYKNIYVADTHAWVYYLLNKLPDKVDKIFLQAEKGEAVIYIPIIALAECIYLVEKGKVSLNFDELFSKLKVTENFIPVPLTLEIVEKLVKYPVLEIHDRIMVVTAKLLNATLITKDKEIIRSKFVKTVWE